MTRSKDERPAWLPDVDLRAVTRDSTKIRTIIEVKGPDGYFYRWLRLGSLSSVGERRDISARYTEGVTDEEHDSAHAVHFDVRGVEFVSLYHGNIVLRAWVAGADEDAETFKVPPKSIMSLDDLGGETCSGEHCGEGKHLIVKYTPNVDLALWKKLRGRELKITIVPVFDEEPES